MRMPRPAYLLLVPGLAACVEAPRPAAAPALPASAALTSPGLHVALVWSAPVDLDLYLTDPTWETAYFANTPSRTGTRLVRDMRCRDLGSSADAFLEQATMAEPLPGRYRVGVDFIDACGAAATSVSFRVVVDYGGERKEVTGTLRLAEFQPIVVEFELRPAPPGGELILVQEGA